MEFKTFLMAFDARVQSRVTNSADRLYYLDQHLVGEPKELIADVSISNRTKAIRKLDAFFKRNMVIRTKSPQRT